MPSLENLKKQAKLVLRWYRDRYHPVAAQIRTVLPRFRDLTDAQILAASFNLGFAVALGKNMPLVRFLLKRGADASSSLWAAVWRDDPVLCRELLKTKPRLNLKAHGETPIFYAARLQRLKTLELLVEAGADPTIRDRRGRDAVDIARDRRLPKDMITRLEDLKRCQPTAKVTRA